MNKETELLGRWEKDKKCHEKWGKWLIKEVLQNLEKEIDPISTKDFIKIPPKERLKDNDSLIVKAFYSGKGYKSPYDEITDKVGIRFVVLLGTDLKKIEAALCKISNFKYSKDRDFEDEQSKKPLQFDYAAIHYIATPNEPFKIDGVTIPVTTHCEVQIKTILQHAYSELTHDRVYKTQINVTSGIRRDTAKAMALLEATNDYFEKVANDVNESLLNVRKMTADLSILYKDLIGINAKPTILEGLFLDVYGNDYNDGDIKKITQFFKEKSFLIDRIKQRLEENNIIFKQPSILLIYWKINETYDNPIETWPLTPNELNPLLNDLGRSTDSLSY